VDLTDAGCAVPGLRVRSTPLWMTDEATTEAMVDAAMAEAGRG
jgi:hypothetical protein